MVLEQAEGGRCGYRNLLKLLVLNTCEFQKSAHFAQLSSLQMVNLLFRRPNQVLGLGTTTINSIIEEDGSIFRKLFKKQAENSFCQEA